MFASEEFNRMIVKWFENTPSDVMCDVLDGRLWKTLTSQGYFKSKYDIVLMMNVDWYRPFKRSEYKVAAIMMTILNLPREERFKKKWTIIAGR